MNAITDISNIGAALKLPISPLVGEMSAQPTEGGAVPPTSHSVAPPSALSGISPTRGETRGFTIVAEQDADILSREALLDAAMGAGRKRKSSEKIRRGRKPSEGLAFVARDAGGRVIGTVRLWDVAMGTISALLLGPLAVDPSIKSAGIGSALMRHAISEAARLGHGAILLVGDAPYYSRFGFSAEKTANLAMPGPFEKPRLLALELVPATLDGAHGVIRATGRKVKAEPTSIVALAA